MQTQKKITVKTTTKVTYWDVNFNHNEKKVSYYKRKFFSNFNFK